MSEPTLRLVAEVPRELKGAGCFIDARFGYRGGKGGDPQVRQASTDGSTLFYEAPLELQAGKECDAAQGGEAGLGHGPGGGSGEQEGPNKYALFARTGESPAVELSVPPPAQCSAGHLCKAAPIQNAHFFGTSPDGTRAWFTTEQPLIDSDTDETNDLYLAKLHEGQLTELVQASAGETVPALHTAGQGAGVRGVVRVSPDGSAAAFVATGVLTANQNSLHRSAQKGADNLYLYDAESGVTKFITELCSGPKNRAPSPIPPARPASTNFSRTTGASGAITLPPKPTSPPTANSSSSPATAASPPPTPTTSRMSTAIPSKAAN